MPLWVQFVYWSGQKISGYITVKLCAHSFFQGHNPPQPTPPLLPNLEHGTSHPPTKYPNQNTCKRNNANIACQPLHEVNLHKILISNIMTLSK